MFHKELPEAAKIVYSGEVHEFILRYLEKDNTEIEQLRRKFLKQRADCRNEALLICIAEEKPTEIQKLVKGTEAMKVLTNTRDYIVNILITCNSA